VRVLPRKAGERGASTLACRAAADVARSSILDGVEQFKSSGHLDRRLSNDLRLVERGVRALDRDVLGP
jgi:hypothetical protein